MLLIPMGSLCDRAPNRARRPTPSREIERSYTNARSEPKRSFSRNRFAMSDIATTLPLVHLSDRSLGWLRYLDRKATTPDR